MAWDRMVAKLVVNATPTLREDGLQGSGEDVASRGEAAPRKTVVFAR